MSKKTEHLKITAKAARINKGKTQKETAVYLGVSKATYANYENGITNPQYDTVKEFAKFVEWPHDDIIFAPKI